MEILIQNSQKTRTKVGRIRDLATRVLQAEKCAETTEVSLLLTDDEGISALNVEYRGVNGPTDVLSFSQHEGDDEFSGEEDLLGDLVISVETAKRQAKEQGKTIDDEIDMLVTHGLLHLLGYDHAEPDEAQRMFKRQDELLA